MRAKERATLRQVRIRIKAGDRAGALRLVEELEARETRRAPNVGDQLALVLVLSLTFRCRRLDRDDMAVKECLIRRTRVWPSGGGRGSPAPAASACIGCPVGAAWSTQVPCFTPPPSTLAAEVMSPTQREAKRHRASVGLEEDGAVRLDPMREAAGLTPDDGSDWRA